MVNIIFIGFKAVGKTTYGKEVAKIKKMGFVDSDDLIESLHLEQRKEDIAFREIYKKYGRKYFRDMEKKALQKIMTMDDKVVALGGGIIEHDPRLVRSLGKVIYLTDRPDVLFSRIKKTGFPEFFDKENPRKSFDELFEKRKEAYEKLSDIKIDVSNMKKTDLIKKIIEVIK